MKNNNKGFSLVELIVVVLIMGIIAVALVPAVMKWVNNSRINTDVQNAESIKASLELVYTEYLADKGTAFGNSDSATIDADGDISFSGVTGSDTSGNQKIFLDAFNEVVGGASKWPDTKYDETGFTATVGAKGAVTVTFGASSATLE